MSSLKVNRTVSLATYSIAFKVPHKSDYFALQDVGGHDSITLVKNFLVDAKSPKADPSQSAIFKTHSVSVDDVERTLRGQIETGEFGYSARGVNVKTEEESYKRTVNDAEMIPLSYMICLPKGERAGLVVLQRFGNVGISTHFITALRAHIKKVVPNVTLEWESMVHPDVVEAYSTTGKAKKIKFRQWLVPKDLADSLGCKLGPKDAYIEYSIIAKKSGALGPISKILSSASSSNAAQLSVPLPGDFRPDETVVEVDINGRTRTVQLNDLNDMNSFYDITENVDYRKDGHPTASSVLEQAEVLVQDMLKILKGARHVQQG